MTTSRAELDLQPIRDVEDMRAVQENFRRLLEFVRTQLPKPTQAGQMVYWDGKQWINITPGKPGQTLKVSSFGVPEWQ